MAQTGIFEEYIIKGLLASRPAATAVTPGTLYGDETGIIYRSDGTTWETYTDPGTGGGGGGVTSVTGTAPIASSGGATPAISLNDTAVTPGSYTNMSATVDAKGRLTAASSGTAPVTSVTGTAPIVSSGGATPAISLADTAVTPGSYTSANITVDAKGRLTAAANGAGGGTIGGSLAATQIPYGSGVDTVAGNSHLTYSVAGGGGSGGHLVSEIIGSGTAALSGWADTGTGVDGEASGAGGWGVYGSSAGAGGIGVVAEVTAVSGTGVEVQGPASMTGKLFRGLVNSVERFFVDALGGIFGRYLDLAEGTAPANPAASTQRVYFKSSDHLPYYRNSSGTETALGGGGGGSASTIYTNAYASPPASPVNGDSWYPSDGIGLYFVRVSGAWVARYQGRPASLPDAQTWSWINQGTATTANLGGALSITAPSVGAENLVLRAKSAPATPYTITAAIMVTPPWTYEFGIGFRESGTGKIHFFFLYQANGNTVQVYSSKFTTATAWSGAHYVNSGALGMPQQPWWVQISDNGTSRICRFSADGATWTTYHTIGRTDYLTGGADQVCWGVNTFGAGTSVTLISWTES